MRRRKGRSSKDKACKQKEHAIRRARERYGLEVSVQEYNEACQRICEGRWIKHLEDESLRLTHYLVELAGKQVPVVFDRHRKTIVTVLPGLVESSR